MKGIDMSGKDVFKRTIASVLVGGFSLIAVLAFFSNGECTTEAAGCSADPRLISTLMIVIPLATSVIFYFLMKKKQI
jgi:hypothetical protein